MSITVHIMRGIPGSGKSTKAREIAVSKEFICSADDYFINKEGLYVFKPHELAQAHGACLKKFIAALHAVKDKQDYFDFDVVVDNTNLRLSEFVPYQQIAQLAKAKVVFHEFIPPRDETLGEYVRLCASRNTHGVSANQCMRMASVFEVRVQK